MMDKSTNAWVYLLEIIFEKDEVQRFAVSDESVVLPEGIYQSQPSWTVSAISSHANLENDLCSIDAPLKDAHRIEAFLKCRVKIYLFDFKTKKLLRWGHVASILREDQKVTLEIKGLTASFDQKLGGVYAPTCRARFGDERCGVNREAFTYEGKVTQKAQDPYLYFFDKGCSESTCVLSSATLLWVGGKNKGETSHVKNYGKYKFTLWAPLKHPISVGDTYKLTLGCDKNLSTCRDVFKNALNFRGEPFVPDAKRLRTRIKH